MKVKLIHATPLDILVQAIRKCYDSGSKSDSGYFEKNEQLLVNEKYKYRLGEKDEALIKRVIEAGHTSTLEHINFTFDLGGYSRALLQEKSRHRHAAVSERSTRYCLKKLKDIKSLVTVQRFPSGQEIFMCNKQEAAKYLVLTGDEDVDNLSIEALDRLRQLLVRKPELRNDVAKYPIPDSLRTECIFTINARSLRNLFSLRISKQALWEFQKLCCYMYESIPFPYKFLVDDLVNKEIYEFWMGSDKPADGGHANLFERYYRV
jgi:thymidylate synthase (FAD)